jgi:hypothetical protein
MSKIEDYRQVLQSLDNWDNYLRKESGLPGPRGNLELAQVVADEGNLETFNRYLQYSHEIAPTNDPGEFLAFCGVVGLGRLLAEGQKEHLPVIRKFASDPRWRLREAVAMAMQRWGDVDMPALIEEMQIWSVGTPYEKRAAIAALCEPRLLINQAEVQKVLLILDEVTQSVKLVTDRHSEEFVALRKGLAYCWSVAVVANPESGKPLIEKWLVDSDKDIRWVVRENLKKNRLIRMDSAWVQVCLEKSY